MRHLLILVVFLATALAAAETEAFSYKMLSPAQADYASTVQNIREVDSGLDALRSNYKDVRAAAYSNDYLGHPSGRAVPHSAATINKLASHMKKLRKSMMKEPYVPEGSSPEEMMLFQQLLSGLKRTSRRRDAEPAMHEANQAELDAMQRLTDQVNLVSNTLESPEENELHSHAHAQSRMLHRITHVLDSMASQMDSEKQRHYEDMLSTLMHQHLADPDYHDTLHDHLLAHHLARSNRDNEFVDHMTHHMLYHNLDQKIGESDYSSAVGSTLGKPMRTQQDALARTQAESLTAQATAQAAQNTQFNNALRNQLASNTNNQYRVPLKV